LGSNKRKKDNGKEGFSRKRRSLSLGVRGEKGEKKDPR